MSQEETIDVLAYLRRLTKFLIPGILVALAVAVPLGLKGSNSTTSYLQKAHVLVMPGKVATEAEATQQGALLSRMMYTYVALDDVPVFVDAIVAAGGDKWTADDVKERLTIVWGGGSSLLAFHAQGADLEDANALADTAAKVFVDKADEMVPAGPQWQPTFTVVETSKQQSAPKTVEGSIMTAVGGGLVAGLFAMLLLEALSHLRRRRVTGTAA